MKTIIAIVVLLITIGCAGVNKAIYHGPDMSVMVNGADITGER